MIQRRFSRIFAMLALVMGAGVIGCQSPYANLPDYHPSTQPIASSGLQEPKPFAPADAVVVVPQGWEADKLKQEDNYSHQVWKSPSGNTCYGIIHFGMPLPLPASLVLPKYLDAMKESEGEANVVGQPQKDDALPGIRLTVECGDYRMRTNFICKGFGGWSVYVGTLRNKPEQPAEIELAERAREKTKIGLPAADAKSAANVTGTEPLVSK